MVSKTNIGQRDLTSVNLSVFGAIDTTWPALFRILIDTWNMPFTFT